MSSKWIWAAIAVVAIVVIIVFTVLAATKKEQAIIASLVDFSGTVTVDGQAAVADQALFEGSVLKTGADSLAVIQFFGHCELRMDENSEATLTKMKLVDNTTDEIVVTIADGSAVWGRAEARIALSYKVVTSAAEIESTGGSAVDFYVVVDSAGNVDAGVPSGAPAGINFTAGGVTQGVDPGNYRRADAGQQPGSQQSGTPSGLSNAFIQFNEYRDWEIEHGYALLLSVAA